MMTGICTPLTAGGTRCLPEFLRCSTRYLEPPATTLSTVAPASTMRDCSICLGSHTEVVCGSDGKTEYPNPCLALCRNAKPYSLGRCPVDDDSGLDDSYFASQSNAEASAGSTFYTTLGVGLAIFAMMFAMLMVLLRSYRHEKKQNISSRGSHGSHGTSVWTDRLPDIMQGGRREASKIQALINNNQDAEGMHWDTGVAAGPDIGQFDAAGRGGHGDKHGTPENRSKIGSPISKIGSPDGAEIEFQPLHSDHFLSPGVKTKFGLAAGFPKHSLTLRKSSENDLTEIDPTIANLVQTAVDQVSHPRPNVRGPLQRSPIKYHLGKKGGESRKCQQQT